MAYVTLVSLLQIVEEKVFGYQFRISFDGERQAEGLIENLKYMKSFLREHPHLASSQGSFLQLERRMGEAAHQILNIIEYHIWFSMCYRRKMDLALDGKTLYIQLRGRKYQTVLRKLHCIVEEVKNIDSTSNSTSGDLLMSLHPAAGVASSSQAPENTNSLVGFDEDIMEIKAKLCGGPSKLQVISIFGMGGIGKTSLARAISDDSLVDYFFHVRAWATVSQDFNLRKILLDLLDSMNIITKELTQERDEHLLVEVVYRNLKGKRYLIVIDDVWSIDAWDCLRRIFPDDYCGSRIMLTSRILDVASHADASGPIHMMRFLDEYQSWNLFEQVVFELGHCPPELEPIGKRIAKSCGGLPLAIIVVAGLLSKIKRTKDHWSSIAEALGYDRMGYNERLPMILSYSYNHLPHCLRACFLYMGSFPEDHEIRVSRLIKLWIAEGFIEPVDESKSLEEVAMDYLKDLVNRSLVLVTKKKPDGELKSCNIHDVLREFCIREAEDENFFVVERKNWIQQGKEKCLWRLCTPFSKTGFKGAHPYIRSLLYYLDPCSADASDDDDNNISVSLPVSTLPLRVLDASLVATQSFIGMVRYLFHLRYLAFNIRRDCRVPREIIRLRNLQVLLVDSIRGIPKPTIHLTHEMWMMRSLRHLNCVKIEFSPIPDDYWDEAPVLENLRTLSTISTFCFTREFPRIVPKLQKLGLVYCDDRNWTKWGLDNLGLLHQLQELNFCFEWSGRIPMPENFHFTLCLPPNLRKLTLSGCRVPWKQMTAVVSLPYLEVLKIKDDSFVGEKWEAIDGSFSRLRVLHMEGLELKHWQVDIANFPILESLIIRKCYESKQIPLDVGNIPTLELIDVRPDHKNLVYSAMQILEQQKELGTDVLQVRVNSQVKVKIPTRSVYPQNSHIRPLRLCIY